MAMDLTRRSDEELYMMLRGSRDLAHGAFDEIYARHSSRVYLYCKRMTSSEEMAEDIYQETFVRFYNSAAQVETMTNAAAYLLRIARNLCLNERQRKHNATVPLEEIHIPACHPTYESNELLKLIETALETLPEEYREAFVLKEYINLSYNEIAAVIGTTMPVIRTRIYRAKAKLRGILAPYLEDLQK
ncbi:MAG: RNA polymerase sigma factor [Candidatus Kapaibacterium sp.]